MATHQVTFTGWNGARRTVDVIVVESSAPGARAYYAKALDTLGCGKDASTPEQAILRLVTDHGATATTTTIEPIEAQQ